MRVTWFMSMTVLIVIAQKTPPINVQREADQASN